jgi:hypothetical protein
LNSANKQGISKKMQTLTDYVAKQSHFCFVFFRHHVVHHFVAAVVETEH